MLIIDALAFSVTPPDERSYTWCLSKWPSSWTLGPIKPGGGLFGFRYSARFGDGVGVIAWGGESQNGRVYFSLMGAGLCTCSGLAGAGPMAGVPLCRHQARGRGL